MKCRQCGWIICPERCGKPWDWDDKPDPVQYTYAPESEAFQALQERIEQLEGEET